MSSKITIHDVARQSGVSIKTVSRVLNREPNVKADTRDRVQAAVAALHYRPNISARSLAGSKAYLIGVFFDNPSPGYITDVQLGAIARCREEGYHLIVEPLDSTADNVEDQVAPMLATLRMDGVILTAPVCDHPVVLAALERELERVRRHGVAFDNEEIEQGLRCIAAPIRDDSGELVAGLSVSAPADRHNPDWAIAVRQAADEISAAIGYVKAGK